MDVERRALYTGVDSWEGEMTYQGTTYKVEVEQRTHRGTATWDLEVLREAKFLVFGYVDVLHCSAHPTLETALDAAENYIRGLTRDTG